MVVLWMLSFAYRRILRHHLRVASGFFGWIEESPKIKQ